MADESEGAAPVRSSGCHRGRRHGRIFARATGYPPPVPVSENPELGRELVSEDQLRATVADLGARIGRDYAGLDPLLVGVLKGAFVFMADLVRAIRMSVAIDFMACSSYGSSTTSSGIVKIVKDLDFDIENRHVLLVEDIVDSGLTLEYLRRTLSMRNPASLEVCALLVRDNVPQVDLASLRYVGFRIPGEWVVGYGLDAGQRWRNLRSIRVWNRPA
jgi:hypoxanthine phosphoribosyltransferase